MGRVEGHRPHVSSPLRGEGDHAKRGGGAPTVSSLSPEAMGRGTAAPLGAGVEG